MRKKLILIAVICVAAALLCVAYGYWIEPRRLVVTEASLSPPRWPKSFDGYKIVAIGDLHGGSNGVDDAKLRRVVELANAQRPDLIVLLGDYVSQRSEDRALGEASLRMPTAEIANGLRGFQAKDGVYAVLGNHDGGYCDDCVRRELERVGIRVIESEVIAIRRGGESFRLFGLPDHMKVGIWKVYSNNAKQALASSAGTGPIIALEHSPDILPIITGDMSISPDLSLILAAHTHGGQVWLPIFGSPIVPSSYGQKYAKGEIRENGVDMYVTSGVGESVLPFRFLVPPEIAVLTLRSE